VLPVILGLVKHASRAGSGSSSLRRVGSGAAPLSKQVADEFRRRFSWVELRQGYGLTESCGAATYFVSDKDAKARSDSSGMLIPSFCAKVVDIETGKALPPYGEGELKSPTIMTSRSGPKGVAEPPQWPKGWPAIPYGVIQLPLYI
jgi:OPC-8:0 CoA ligase-1